VGSGVRCLHPTCVGASVPPRLQRVWRLLHQQKVFWSLGASGSV
jgi:hypothetical protein